MKIRNVSPDDRYVPALECVVAAGEVVDVPDELAASLLDQPEVWATPAKPSKES